MSQEDLPLIDNEVDNVVVFSAEKYLPFGDVTPMQILRITPNKENKDEEINYYQIPKENNKSYKHQRDPFPMSQVIFIFF